MCSDNSGGKSVFPPDIHPDLKNNQELETRKPVEGIFYSSTTYFQNVLKKVIYQA